MRKLGRLICLLMVIAWVLVGVVTPQVDAAKKGDIPEQALAVLQAYGTRFDPNHVLYKDTTIRLEGKAQHGLWHITIHDANNTLVAVVMGDRLTYFYGKGPWIPHLRNLANSIPRKP